MSQPSSVSARVPLIVAAAGVVLVAVLVLALVHVHTVSQHHRASVKSGYGLTATQQAAVTAAATEAANIVTFNRKSFNADFARALNGSTGKLKSDLTGEKALTLNTMTSGKFDLKGTIGASAYIGQTEDGTGQEVLVTVNGFKIADAANGSSSSVQRLVLTMVKTGKVWLASSLSAVGVQ